MTFEITPKVKVKRDKTAWCANCVIPGSLSRQRMR